MIVHVSMPADDCLKVARVLAELMKGHALPFPPGGPDAWNAWSENGEIQIVVTPRGHFLLPGEQEMIMSPHPATERFAETHFALRVDRSAEEILDIARRAEWPARICDRGGFFHVVELWVEGVYMVELLDPAFALEYQRSMTVENWAATFGAGSAV